MTQDEKPHVSATERTEASALPRTSPEDEGISSAAIREFVEAADAQVDKIHSFMVVRHGHVAAEGWWAPHSPEAPHIMHSLSKSFTSTAVGFAIADGKLDLDDTVLRFFPEDAPPEPSANLKTMSVRNLLTMSTGHETESSRDPSSDVPWTKTFLSHPLPYEPGTHFLYNSTATYMLSAIVQKLTGQTVLDYLKPRLFAPLGIQYPEWGTSPQGITLGGWGLWLRTEDIAKFGQLLLQNGQWNGQQLVPEAWIEAATAKQVANGSDPESDWNQGYGYQFWRCRHGAYRGDGANGQFCVVMPEQDAVVAMTSNTRDMHAELRLVWKYLLPAMQPVPLAENANEWARLKETIGRVTEAGG